MQFSPFFLLGVNFLIFDTEQSGVLSLSRESSIPTRAQSFDWIHPFLSLSTLEKICSDQEYVHINKYIVYIWDFLHFFITSSSLLAIANTNIMDNDAWLANVRSESQTLFRSGSVIRFLVFRILELFFWL